MQADARSADKALHPGGLPVRHDLRLATALSLVAALILAGVSAAGLIAPTAFYPTGEARLAFVPNDAFNLAVVVPLLLASMWLARRGKLAGLLLWPGALFTVLYTYIPYALGLPIGPLFLAYLALLPLSAVALIGLVAGIDGEALAQRLDSPALARIGGGILLLLAVAIAGRQGALAVGAVGDPSTVGPLERAVLVGDFAVALPALLVVGAGLWRRSGLGYIGGAGLFVSYAVLVVALFPVMIFQAAQGGPPVGMVDVVVLLVMAALCAVPGGLLLRRAAESAG